MVSGSHRRGRKEEKIYSKMKPCLLKLVSSTWLSADCMPQPGVAGPTILEQMYAAFALRLCFVDVLLSPLSLSLSRHAYSRAQWLGGIKATVVKYRPQGEALFQHTCFNVRSLTASRAAPCSLTPRPQFSTLVAS
jgi:hypothetical protein